MPQLASPEEFIGPSLAQAWADYQVAIHLSDTGLDDNIHRGRPACDAAMAKFQQSLEKALCAVLLRFCPERSEWAFFHKYLSSNVKEVRQKAKRELSKVLEFLHHDYARSLSLRLAALEKHVPDPGRATPDKKSGKLVALPENAEYPYTEGGRTVAPFQTYGKFGGMYILAVKKDLDTLFKELSKKKEFSEFLKGYGG